MNPDRFQSNPSKSFESVTVPDTEGDAVTVKVADAFGKPAVWIFEHDTSAGITLTPREATHLAQALLEAADAADDPAARRILRVLEEYATRRMHAERVAREQAERVALWDSKPGEHVAMLDEDDEDDIDPADRIKAAEGMEAIVAEMRAAGCATVGELFAMKREQAAKANAG